ncbi:ribosomal RNA small subunit methyltransferase I [bacterium BMS3Abin14]|nr:ribosomal RNA small subunit methyltransferase I [bacterium BMS3Abin14]
MNPGALYMVATPIGNLDDITRRAVLTLQSVAIVAAEDTRRTRKLLSHLDITKRLVSYREENRETASIRILEALEKGRSVALVTDAGTPGLSDPGHHLVRAARDRGIQVVPVPGPNALGAALSVSGMSLERFIFEGFLPTRTAARKRRLRELAYAGYPLVIYESPHRIRDALTDILDVLGNREAMVAREITKIHEEFMRGSVKSILDMMEDRKIKGEITLLLAEGETPCLPMDLDRAVKEMRQAGLSAKRTASILSGLTGENKREIYKKACEAKEE